jgi:SAM-dependent methyltransferase
MGRGRICPICGWEGYQFLPQMHPRMPHFDAICPNCGSNERSRFSFVVMRDRIKGTERMLHFAPEKSLKAWLKASVGEYHSCDIEPGKADHVVDIQNIQFEDDSFDLVWCSHVLEHVPDDRRAMRELCRITRPGGTALIQVPLFHEVTDEDPTITDKAELARRFFQNNHLRLYGYDIKDRLEEAGFTVKVITPVHFGPEIIFTHQIAQAGDYEIFLCTKDKSGH